MEIPFPGEIRRYLQLGKISGPLLDRIDIHIEVPAVPFQELSSSVTGTASSDMREQVLAARRVQMERFKHLGARYNAQMSTRQIRQFCPLDKACAQLLKDSVHELGLSARAHDKVLRVARTIADLAGAAEIAPEHISEAVNYRMLDRQFWT